MKHLSNHTSNRSLDGKYKTSHLFFHNHVRFQNQILL